MGELPSGQERCERSVKKINGVEYVEIPDLATLWGQDKKYLSNLAYRAQGWKGSRRIPHADIQEPRRKYWRYDRIDELNKWWEIVKGGEVTTTTKETDKEEGSQEVATAKTAKEIATPDYGKSPAQVKADEQTVFIGADITLTISHEFPAFKDSHVLAVVKRHDGETTTAKYFITREQADAFMELFK